MTIFLVFKKWRDSEGWENETFKAVFSKKDNAKIAVKTLNKCERGEYFIREEELL